MELKEESNCLSSFLNLRKFFPMVIEEFQSSSMKMNDFNNDINFPINDSQENLLDKEHLKFNSYYNNIFPPISESINKNTKFNKKNKSNNMLRHNLLNFDDLLDLLNSIKDSKNENNLNAKPNKKKEKFICNFCNKNYKRKEYLTKHTFFKHTNYKGILCPICGKKIIYFHEHIKYCKMKYESNISSKNNSQIFSTNILELGHINTFNDLRSLNINSENKNFNPILDIKNKKKYKLRFFQIFF